MKKMESALKRCEITGSYYTSFETRFKKMKKMESGLKSCEITGSYFTSFETRFNLLHSVFKLKQIFYTLSMFTLMTSYFKKWKL
jgi:hypothetical protein